MERLGPTVRDCRPSILGRAVGERGVLARDKRAGRLARSILGAAVRGARAIRCRAASPQRALRRLAVQKRPTAAHIFNDDEAGEVGGALYRNALAAIERGNLPRGERLLRRASRRWPSVGWFSYRLGSVLAAQARHGEAAAIFAAGNSLRLAPDLVTDTRILLVGSDHPTASTGGLGAGDTFIVAPDLAKAPAAALLFLCCDAAYFRLYAEAAIASALANSGLGLACHVHVVNPDRAAIEEQNRITLRHAGAAVSFSHETTDLSRRSATERRVYYACRRYQLLPALLRRVGGPVVVADIDQLVVRSLEPVLAIVRDADVGLIQYGGVALSNALSVISASAAVAAATSGAGRYFGLVAAYIDHCLAHDLWVWHLDQAALYAVELTVEARGEPVRLRRLDPAILESTVFDAAATGVPAPETIFWSITHSLQSNAAKRDLDLFARYRTPGRDRAAS
jgi:hypothetical protein